MPITLWRYILSELWKLVLISTGVLVAVIAFAATVKPLADGKLTPVEALQFMVFAIPPMLAYALPFAAGFATTLAYHRLAQDNEVLAAKAGGIAQRSLLMPALITGIVLSIGLGALNEQVIPRFLRSMESMITRNLIQMMVRTIERGDAAEFADMEIHADRIRRLEPEPGSPVIDQYEMFNVTALAFDEDKKVQTDVSAKRVLLWLVPASAAGLDDVGSDAVAFIRFEDFVAGDSGSVVQQAHFTPQAVRVPNPFEDDPKYLTFGELRALKRRPERMNWIDAQRMEVARRIAARETVASLVRRLHLEGEARFHDSQGRDIVVHSSGFGHEGWTLQPAPGSDRIQLEMYHRPDEPGAGGMDRFAAREGTIDLESAQNDPTRPIDDTSLTFSLTLRGVTLLGAAELELAPDTGQTEQEERVFHGLEPRQDALAPLRDLSARQMVAEARTAEARYESGTAAIAGAADDLEEQLQSLHREIVSKEHERMAMSVSCLVMVLTGAVTALRLREALPLVVYLWSFFPALIAIITINTGQQVTHGTGMIGLVLLWGGVLALAVYTLLAFRVVARH